MPYTDLITQSELTTDAQKSLSADDATAIASAITDATSRIEGYLNRKLIVREHVQPITQSEWREDAVTDDYYAWANEWPVVEVGTSGYTAHTSSHKLQASDPDDEAVTYYAGYRRSDQDLAALQNELSGLGTLPDVLPGDIRRVCTELVLYMLHQARDGTYGRGSITQEVGTTTMTVERADVGFEKRVLRRLDRYKRRI